VYVSGASFTHWHVPGTVRSSRPIQVFGCRSLIKKLASAAVSITTR